MKVRAIIQARMGSAGLRGRCLMSLNGVPVLYRVIASLEQFSFVDEIHIATTAATEDDPVEAAASGRGYPVYRGSSLDLLDRYFKASLDLAEDDCIVRITADNIFYDPDLAEKLFSSHVASGADYTCIDGLSKITGEYIRVGALREIAHDDRVDYFDRQHLTAFFRRHPQRFLLNRLPADFEGLRRDLDPHLTVDTIENIENLERMIRDLGLDEKPGPLREKYDWVESEILRRDLAASPKGGGEINLAGVPVGCRNPAYIIAEIGQNHNGDVRMARKLIDMAARCGANAVKFQKRDIPSELTGEAFNRPYENPVSFGRTYGEHRQALELSEEQHLELKEYCTARGITYFCTPCDLPSLEMLERIGSPFYKVASRDLTNIPLLEALGKTHKPVILSTGMANEEDIEDALLALNRSPDSVIILHCTSEYPCSLDNVNLDAMLTLRQRFGYPVGYSDHTAGVMVSIAAVVKGAILIEKHVTLDRSLKGTDHAGSLEEYDLYQLVKSIRGVERSRGDGAKVPPRAVEAARIKLARSLTSRVAIPEGSALTEDMICLKSPGSGLIWRQRHRILGKTATRDIAADTTLLEEDFR